MFSFFMCICCTTPEDEAWSTQVGTICTCIHRAKSPDTRNSLNSINSSARRREDIMMQGASVLRHHRCRSRY